MVPCTPAVYGRSGRDVGAGKGEDTMVFSKAVGLKGRVLAVEAHPITFRCLELFRELNDLSNVIVRNCTVIDRIERVAIENCDDWTANGVSLE